MDLHELEQRMDAAENQERLGADTKWDRKARLLNRQRAGWWVRVGWPVISWAIVFGGSAFAAYVYLEWLRG